MNYIIINLSPRKKGTSNMLSEYFDDRLKSEVNSIETCDLYSNLDKMDNLLNKIKASDTIVLIGPCYVDSFPADTINLLVAMSSKEDVLHGQSLYGFIQGGMPYIHTHEHGIKLLSCFGDEADVNFKGGFVMGGGAMLDGKPLDNIIGAKKMVPAVNEFIESIKNNKNSPEELYMNAVTKMPVLVTKLLAFMMNKMIKKSLKEKGIDYKAPSPYIK
jgi:hypothetical protein